MAMSITHNLMAVNAGRMFTITNKSKAKNTEKLASGYRINRAADDAAGLAISEKMRYRIRGLRQGMDNIQDGISLCNVADGALEEVHDMLHRMEELAVKAANGTNSEDDRNAINEEMEQLKTEIDRIGATTTFNEKLVFGGEYEQSFVPTAEGKFFKILGDNVSHTGYMEEPLDSTKLASLPNTGLHQKEDHPFVSVHIDFDQLIKDKKIDKLVGTDFYVNCCTNCCPRKVVFTDGTNIEQKGGDTLYIGLKKADGADEKYYDDAEELCKAIVKAAGGFAAHVEFACENSTLYIYDIDANEWSESSKKKAYFCDVPGKYSTTVKSNDFWIKMSDQGMDALFVDIGDLNTKVLHINNNDCLTAETARDFIDALKYADAAVSEMRSTIGSYTNRLQHSYNVNSNAHENTTAAESRIRDTDIAKTMVDYSNQNILEQAGASMLTQANQQPNFILQLLQ